MKISAPRLKWLRDIAASPVNADPNYPPAKWSVAQGLAAMKEGRWGHPTFTIAQTGTDMLAAIDAEGTK